MGRSNSHRRSTGNGKSNNSKRARTARKEACAAGLPGCVAHPSHRSGVRRWERVYAERRGEEEFNECEVRMGLSDGNE